MSRPARQPWRRLAQFSLAAIIGIVGLPVLNSANNVANAVETVSCVPSANVFVGMANSDDFRLRKQTYPADGYPNWASDAGVGWGWNERFMSGPNGYLWFIETDGELRRHRWTGSTWDNGGISELIQTGWFGWDLAAYHFRVTVDQNNHIYSAQSNGELAVHIYNESTKALPRKVISTGWNKYDQITAAGAGVIYARDPNINGGTLYRFKYDAATNKWFNYDTNQWQDQEWRRDVGYGWNGYKQISSPGGDILWGTYPGGETWWYRYMPKYNFWEINASGDWKSQIATWNNVDEIAPAIDSCKTGDFASDVDCAANAKIWGSLHNDQLWMRAHNEPETGVTSWQKQVHLGNGWNASRFMGGAKGYKFFIEPDGEFRTHRWMEPAGQAGYWDNGGISQVIATGWMGWNNTAYHHRVTVDSNNHVYAALANGQLEFNVFDEATKTLTQKQIIDDGWGRFDQVLAAGDGVIYARDPSIDSGTLYRFQYDWKNRRWIEYARNVGWGWNGYSQILSPGGDVIYGVTGNDIWWYRYDNTAKVFASTAEGEPKKRVSWWADLKEVMVDVDSCKLTTPDKITPPQTPAPAVDKAEMIYNAQKSRFEIAYSDEVGTLRQLYQQVPNSELLAVNALSSTGFTGRATIAQREDNKVVVQARGTNAQVKSFLEPPSSQFQWTQKDVNGALNSSPVLVRGTNKVLTAFAVDGQNKLWFSEQFGINGEFKPWRKATAPDDYNMTGDMTVVAAGDGFEIAYTSPNGTVAVKRFVNGGLKQHRVAAGITGVGAPAAVVFADGKVQLVVRASNNKLYTQKEGASGFAGWADISGAMTFTGTPEALLNKFNVIEVVARDAGGSIHRGGQTAPGSTTWRLWADTMVTSPFDVTFAASTGNEQRIFANAGDGNYYLIDAPPYSSEQSQAMAADATGSMEKSSRKAPVNATKQRVTK